MITTVGRYFFLLLLLAIGLTGYATDINMRITALDGSPLQEAAAGHPFLLTVTVVQAESSSQTPTIKENPAITLRSRGFQLQMLNNNTTITHQYQVTIATPGTYTLGPAEISTSGGTIRSKPLSVTVSHEQKTVAPAKKNTQSQSSASFIRLSAPSTAVFVGQSIPVQLTFYTADTTVSLQALNEPDSLRPAGFEISKKNGPTTGTETLNNTLYRYARWDYTLKARQAGSLVIPAFSIDYTAAARHDIFSFFFTVPSAPKRVYSNTAPLMVHPLPPAPFSNTPFIGTINSYTATIQPMHARVGEGMVLTLTMIGTGDFDALQNHDLAHMPAACKWYFSKQYQTTHPNGISFVQEFIIQPLQAGSWTIPAQSFTYFDTNVKKYSTIQTHDLIFKAEGASTAALTIPSQPILTPVDAPSSSAVSPVEPCIPPTPEVSLTWWYWIGLATTSISFLIAFFLPHPFIASLRWYKPNPFSQARKEIKNIALSSNYEQVYRLVCHVAGALVHKPGQLIGEEEVSHYLQQAGVAPSLIQEWQVFFSKVSQLMYDRHRTYEDPAIIDQSLFWVDFLEKISRKRL